MSIKFHGRLNQKRDELFVVARGDDRPNIIAEVTGLLEMEGLYVSSIAFNLTAPEQDQFLMEIVAKGPERKLEKALLAFDSDLIFAETPESSQRWPKIRWSRASMFHIALSTPDRAGIVAAISRIVGAANSPSAEVAAPMSGSFVHLLGMIDDSGNSAQGSTPYFILRANVAAQNPRTRDSIIAQLKNSANDLGFGADDLRIIPLDSPART
jgi:predicted amino acid-binding ACT domain protein